ncbi:hypothetical protein K438DRAFT_358703 [Mycena galopus ATCC 62051]|nr:hypothetical protein K438DRAFT_358703 [Mycena galopus ATCC 62051]
MITAKANGNLYREFFFVSTPSGISSLLSRLMVRPPTSLQLFRKQGMNITVTFFDLLIVKKDPFSEQYLAPPCYCNLLCRLAGCRAVRGATYRSMG